MTYNLREKHDEYYCVVTYRDRNNKRKEKWIPLKLSSKGDNKRAAKQMLDRLSTPGAIDPEDVEKTNKTMQELGLFLFDPGCHIIRDESFKQNPVGRPIMYDSDQQMTSAEMLQMEKALKAQKKVLFGTYLVYWYTIHRQTISKVSAASISGQIYHIIAPWFNENKITLTGLSPEDIEQFEREEMVSGISPNTALHYHGTIRCALQYAFKKGYVVNNVADRVEKPKKVEFKGDFYNEAELKKLFVAADRTNLEFAVHMAAYYGLRREEICGIKWDAIDFQYKTITIKGTVSQATLDGKYQLFLKDTTKNKSSFRTLPLSDTTIDMLLDMKERQEKMEKIFGDRYNHQFDGYVYTFENGDLVRPAWITENFPKLLKDNGLRKIRFHDLRHSCATLLRHAGVPMTDIQKWLGHSTILTTEQIYAHYDEGQKKGTLNTITSLLDKPDGNKKKDEKERSAQ